MRRYLQLAAAGAALAFGHRAFAQGVPVAPPRPARDAVVLEVRPRVGDTVGVRLEHNVEMTGTRLMTDRDSTVRVSSSMLMLARTMVESVDAQGAVVVMRTDSVALTSSDDHTGAMRDDARRSLRGASSRLRLLPDGTAQSLDDGLGPQGASLLAVMPATLPKRAVKVGESWTQSMPMPSSAGRSAGGEVKATFRLDSLTSEGRFAWISMKGTLRREDAPLEGAAATAAGDRPGSMSGVLSGAMRLDRQRGWVVDSYTTMTVKSVVAAPNSPETPLRVTVRIAQRMRATERD